VPIASKTTHPSTKHVPRATCCVIRCQNEVCHRLERYLGQGDSPASGGRRADLQALRETSWVDTGTCCTSDEVTHGPLPVQGVLVDPLHGVQLPDSHFVIDLRAAAKIVS